MPRCRRRSASTTSASGTCIGDLHDRSGDIIKARRFFGMIAEVDPDFADVSDRLRGLGR